MQGRIKTYNEDRAFGFIIGEDGHDYFFHISNWNSASPIVRGSSVSFAPGETEKGKIATGIELIAQKPEFVSFGNERLKLNNIKTYGISNRDINSQYFAKVYELKTLPISKASGKFDYVNNCLCQTTEKIKVDKVEAVDCNIYNSPFVAVSFLDKLAKKVRYKTKLIKDENGNIRGLTRADGIIRDINGAVLSNGYIFSFNDIRMTTKDIEEVHEAEGYLYVTTFQNTNYQWFEKSASFDIYEKCKELDQYLGVEKR